MRNRNTPNRNLLLYGIISFCLTVFIFGLLFIQPRQYPKQPRTFQSINQQPTPTPIKKSSCSPQKIKEVSFPGLPIVPFAGSTTFAPLNKPDVLAVIRNAHLTLQYIDPARYGEAPGSGTGIKWLIKDKHSLSFAQSSRPLNDEEIQLANNWNVRLKRVPVAFDIIAIYVNPNLTKEGLQGLTLAQVQDIFTGRITNWKYVGGPHLKITPFRRNSQDSGTVEFFKKSVMNNQEFGPNVNPVGQKGKPEEQITTLAIRKVASTLGSISFATASEVINQDGIRILPIAKEDKPPVSPCADETCKGINTNVIAKQVYPEQLARKLFVVIKQDGGQDEKVGEAYANMLKSCEGQKMVEQAGFVPL